MCGMCGTEMGWHDPWSWTDSLEWRRGLCGPPGNARPPGLEIVYLVLVVYLVIGKGRLSVATVVRLLGLALFAGRAAHSQVVVVLIFGPWTATLWFTRHGTEVV